MEEGQQHDSVDYELHHHQTSTTSDNVVPPTAASVIVDRPASLISAGNNIVGGIINDDDIPEAFGVKVVSKMNRSWPCCASSMTIADANHSDEHTNSDANRPKLSFENFRANEAEYNTVLADANNNSTEWVSEFPLRQRFDNVILE
jgi:hypothetical protein